MAADEALSAGSKPKLPKWITDHFKESLEAHELLNNIIDVSAHGIAVLQGMPKLVKAVAAAESKEDQPDTKHRLERAEKEAALATGEVQRDFPVLHGLAVVATWSWLEHFVKGFVALWIVHRRDAMAHPAISKLRVRVGEFAPLSRLEQAHMLVDLLEQDVGSQHRKGLTRFECLLEPFGLTCAIPEETRRALFELQQVRNSIAHKNGRADRRLKAECPWLKLNLNQPVLVSRQMMKAYSNAAGMVLLHLLYKVGDVHCVDLRDAVPGLPEAARVEPRRT